MKNIRITFLGFFSSVLFFSTLTGCTTGVGIYNEYGVSKELAIFRKELISDLSYTLRFSIPLKKDSVVTGNACIRFNLKERGVIILDFKQDSGAVKSVISNNKPIKYSFEKEHIVISKKYSFLGENKIEIVFIAGDQSLNRRDEFLYTLLVPDRARTLFPCFDQPDLKAEYNLSLEIPTEWSAVANGKELIKKSVEVSVKEPFSVSRKIIEFAKTEPIPTYLFSFVAGKLNKITQNKNGREISMYHRETDPQKLAQINTIFDEVFLSLEWLEEYTGIKYPFTKYDFIILPGFQYGGMEHTGATLYADRTMFLEKNATIEEQMDRSKLIAHETAHMWFGDYVTMKWFDDVWTKEVFANYFASAIVAPLYPSVNHKLNFINTYYPAAYSEDRTFGSNPIQQQLGNLNNAGLVYGNIIYNKAPVVMEMLVKRIGEEKFKDGIRMYLKSFAYSNATWDDLIKILDSLTDEDLLDWSNVWVKERGMPEISAKIANDSLVTDSMQIDSMITDNLVICQSDKYGRGVNWKQPLKFGRIYDNEKNSTYVIPNINGFGYGYFKLDSLTSDYLLDNLSSIKDAALNNEISKVSLLITLNENLLNNNLDPTKFIHSLLDFASFESNTLLFSRALGYISNAYILFISDKGVDFYLEKQLWAMVTENANAQHRTLAFRALVDIANSEDAVSKLFEIWSNPASFKYVALGERDLIKLSFELSLRLPDKFKEITSAQLTRITNPDRIKEYRYILPALSPNKATRDSVFNSLLDAKNRKIEPWTVSVLSYLNHYKRDAESVDYILPGLNLMEEIQRTGDIFFPRNWSRALLGGHRSIEAARLVDSFFVMHKDYPPMLASKIWQQSHQFQIVNKKL